MNEDIIDKCWDVSFETLYQSTFQELASEALVTRWQWIDLVTSVLVAVTASGSAVAGWTLWNAPDWKVVWGIIAGIASLLAIIHRIMGVPGRVKAQEDIRRGFSELRVELESFRQQLKLGFDANRVDSEYNKLRRKYEECMRRTHPEIAFTKRLRDKVTNLVKDKLKEYIQ